MLVVFFFVTVSAAIIQAVTIGALSEYSSSRGLVASRFAYVAAEAGVEDILYRLKNVKVVPSALTMVLNGATSTITVTSPATEKEIFATGNADGHVRKLYMKTVQGEGVDFNYGVQIGDGGLVMENSSSVNGNVNSSGPITGGGNVVRGDVISAGPSGSVSGIHATSSIYAHTITNSTIDKDAYYQTISGSSVAGVSYPGSPDQATSTLPIDDALVTDLENEAAAGGTISSPCPYIISSDTTIGPKKINCDLEINDDTVTLTGPIWVNGNIDIKNTAIIRASSSLGSQSVAMIADKATNRTTSSKVSLQNSATFYGSGTAGSYIMLLSQNNSAELGGSEKAIDVKNSVSGALLVYAGHGEVTLENNVNLKEVSAYKLRLKNSATVVYETGVASPLFSGGPSAGWNVEVWSEY